MKTFLVKEAIEELTFNPEFSVAKYTNINEDFGQKDLIRMQDIKTKADGNHDKEISLATTQANIIQDAGKAKARAEAAEQVFGSGSDIAQIFSDRAIILGGSYVKSVASPGAIAPVVGPKIKGEKLKREFKKNYIMPSERIKQPASTISLNKPGSGFSRGLDPKAAMSTGIYADSPEIGGEYHYRAAAILPLGKVNLGTGESPMFNVRKTWEDEGTVEVWQARDGKRKLIFTSGDKPGDKINDTRNFKHDQTGGMIGRNWKLVDYAPLKELQELIRLYGSSLSGYTYK
ncbi:MAG: hypothetical protein WC554_08910 [Clostridia bacterium]